MTESSLPVSPKHPPFTWSDCVKYGLSGYALYALNVSVHYTYRLKGLFRAPAKGPDLVKRYACRPSLEVYFHYPPSYDKTAGPENKKLPTLLTIHGGGFVIGNPEDSNAWNYDFVREKHATLVVSLNYRKGPVHPFPAAVHDIEALALAILADKSLPIDTDQVAIAGWSAGGNLAFSLASLPSMQGRVRAIVPIYPVTTFVTQAPRKGTARHYKPDLPGRRSGPRDFLAPLVPVFNWSYMPRGFTPAEVSNPLLSTTYLPKASLPPYIFTIGCELDLLAHEAWITISKLAGRGVPAASKAGTADVHEPGKLIWDDERFAFEERTETSSYKWLLLPDTIHGFDMTVVELFKKDPLYDEHKIKRDLCLTLINEWLFSGPFKD